MPRFQWDSAQLPGMRDAVAGMISPQCHPSSFVRQNHVSYSCLVVFPYHKNSTRQPMKHTCRRKQTIFKGQKRWSPGKLWKHRSNIPHSAFVGWFSTPSFATSDRRFQVLDASRAQNMAIVLSHWRQQWGEVAKLLQSKKVTACNHQKDREVNYHYFSGM